MDASTVHQVTAALNTGAVPNLVIKDFLPTDYTRRIKPLNDPGLKAATNTSVILDYLILLHEWIGDLRFCVSFGIVDLLTVALLVGTSFIDRFTMAILPQDRNVVTPHSIPANTLYEASTKATAMLVEDY